MLPQLKKILKREKINKKQNKQEKKARKQNKKKCPSGKSQKIKSNLFQVSALFQASMMPRTFHIPLYDPREEGFTPFNVKMRNLWNGEVTIPALVTKQGRGGLRNGVSQSRVLSAVPPTSSDALAYLSIILTVLNSSLAPKPIKEILLAAATRPPG